MSTHLISNRNIEINRWRLPTQTDFMNERPFEFIRYDTLLTNKKNLRPLGVLIQSDEDITLLKPHLDNIDVVALLITNFSDGRVYTQATLLRKHFGFKGEIRAIGAHRDNLALLERSGVNAFELTGSEDLNSALQTFTELEPESTK